MFIFSRVFVAFIFRLNHDSHSVSTFEPIEFSGCLLQ